MLWPPRRQVRLIVLDVASACPAGRVTCASGWPGPSETRIDQCPCRRNACGRDVPAQADQGADARAARRSGGRDASAAQALAVAPRSRLTPSGSCTWWPSNRTDRQPAGPAGRRRRTPARSARPARCRGRSRAARIASTRRSGRPVAVGALGRLEGDPHQLGQQRATPCTQSPGVRGDPVDLGVRTEPAGRLLDLGADLLGDPAGLGHAGPGHAAGVTDDDPGRGAPQRPLRGVRPDRQPLQQGHQEPPDVADARVAAR